jgi:1-acyl-sn-glycerol-3-phosphate acyltransferase
VAEVRDVSVLRWLPIDGPTRVRTEVLSHDGSEAVVELSAWREAGDPALSRFEPVARGTVRVGAAEAPPAAWSELSGTSIDDPYASGHLFHGPAFRYLTRWTLADGGSSALLDASAGSVPHGTLGQGLLDALTHVLPHDDVHRWDPSVPADQVAYPYQVKRLSLYGERPTGEVRVEARYDGLEGERHPSFRLQAVDVARGQVWCELDLVEVLFPKGPIGSADRADRLAFLRDRAPVAGLGLSTHDGDTTTATLAAVKGSDWLPGTVKRLYASEGDLLTDVAVGDHVAHRADVHPGTVSLHEGVATSSVLPYSRFPVSVLRDPTSATVRADGPEQLDLSPVKDWWDAWFDLGRWPVEDLYYGLMERFIRRVVTPEPEALAAIHGRSVLYLANHQVGVESLLFSVLASALNGMSTVTLAKIEHQQTWLGRLIGHSFQWPGARDPKVITFFDRSDKASLPRIIGELSAEMTSTGKSVMVHVEGTRSLHCRREPVQKMSSAFIDMALANRVPIVPVRFAGALPTEPLDQRNEFPTGMGRQDLYLGAPIEPEVLAALPFKERKEHVLASINGLGPDWREESPLPGDPELLRRSIERAQTTGAEPAHAALLEVLLEREPTSEGLALLLEGARKGSLSLPDTDEGRWLAVLAERLYGPKGPTIG